MFQEGTDRVLDDQLQRPTITPPAKPTFSLSGVARGAAKGVGEGAAEALAFGAEITGAFGQVVGAYPELAGPGPVPLTDEQRKQAEQSRQKLLNQGVDFSNEAGDIFRTRAREIMPDPNTTHAAEQITAGLSSFAAKALGYTLAGGPAVPFLLGGDVGMAEADKLKREGVDLATRTKAGAVAGAVAGGSVVAPVVGSTALKTAGLVAAAGPGGFIAQNATTRAILQNAGYKDIANQYDPFDPVGLTLSTLIPGAIGGVALRARASRPAATLADVALGLESGGQRYGPDGKLLTSPKGAQGEMQVMPKTATDPGFGVTPARDNSPDELARVGRDYLAAMQQRYGDDAKALAAYNAGPGAVDAALKQGGDWLSHLPAETQAYVAKGMQRMGGEEVAAAVRQNPDLVDAARVQQVSETMDSFRLTRDDDLGGMAAHQQAIERAQDMLNRGDRVEVSDLLADHPIDSQRARAVVDHYGDLYADMVPRYEVPAASQATLRLDERGQPEIRTSQIRLTDAHPTARIEAVGENGQPAELTRFAIRSPEGEVLGHVELQLEGGKVVSLYDIETTPGLRKTGVASKVVEAITSLEPDRKIEISNIVDEAVPFWEKVGAQVSDGNRSPTLDWHQFAESPSGRSRGAPRRGESLARELEADDARAAQGDGRAAFETRELTPEEAAAFGFHEPPGKGEGEAGQAAIERAATEVAGVDPNMLVQLDGMEHPVRVGDLLEAVRKEAADEKRDSRLIEIAASCALRHQ